jgi:NitT/TauT family transport system ATP-binding protein
MDEPFGALDPHTKETMQILLRDIWQKEKPTIVFITHDIDEAVFMSNRVYVMSARPGIIQETIPVYLPYERTRDLKDEPEFRFIRNKINKMLYD